MRLLVLGATGGTGREIVEQALGRGHAVTVFARSPDKLGIRHDGLRVIQGSLPQDDERLGEAVWGQNAVISSLGVGNATKSGGIMARSMTALVPAMERHGVRRLLMVSAFGVGETRRDVPIVPRIAQRLLLGDVFADKEAAGEILRSTELEWTTIHPSILTNGPRTERYRHGERLALRGLPTISRADVAHFVLGQIEDASSVRKAVLVTG